MTTPTLSHQTKIEKVQKTSEHKQPIAHNSETTSNLAKEPQLLRFAIKRVPIDKQAIFTTQKVTMERKEN
jgi:polynucleotide 5'-kinase involved in rRNA processing